MVAILINKPNGYFLIFIFFNLCGTFDITHSPYIIETLSSPAEIFGLVVPQESQTPHALGLSH